MAMTGKIVFKRVYDDPEQTDGLRILVDRVWPRGKTKEMVACSMWAKRITPSTALRKAFHAGDITGEQFAAAYEEELGSNPALPEFVQDVADALAEQNVTLVTAAKLVEHGHCEVLRKVLYSQLTG